MNNREKGAHLVGQYVDRLRCPICQGSMNVFELKSLICSNNHTFDFAKQGYVNLMTRPANNQYDKKLFEARRQVITSSPLYEGLHETISAIVREYEQPDNLPGIMLDAGSGEGSHLQKVLNQCDEERITGIGLDISKEGIVMAAQAYKDVIWFVADLAHTPLHSQSCDVILNILSPANYGEFQRLLKSQGIVIKVLPRANYLKELRKTVFNDTDEHTYQNDDTVSLFKKHFNSVDHRQLFYTKSLSRTELVQLTQMSPLAWHSDQDQLHTFINQKKTEITIDLDILIGRNE